MKTNKYSISASSALFVAFFTLNLSLLAQDFPTQILSQKPIDYWRLDETNSSPPADLVSNYGSAGPTANGYLVSAIRGAPGGIVGNYVAFTNTGQNIEDCYSRIDIPNRAALNPQPPFTIEFWAKVNTPFNPQNDGSPPTGLCALASLSPFPGLVSRSGYVFYATPGHWAMRVGGEASYTATAYWNGNIDGSWQHVVGEFDGTNLTIYVNGVEGSVSNFPGGNLASTGSPFYPNKWVPTRIGGTDLTGGEYEDDLGGDIYPDGNRGWDGGIDEVAIYSTLLSSNTIVTHYNTALNNPGAYDALVLASAPVGYWNFDEPAYTPPTPSALTTTSDLGSLGETGTNTVGTMAAQPGVPDLTDGDYSVTYNGVFGSMVLSTNLPGQYFGIPGSPGAGNGRQITLAAWIKPISFGYISDIIAQGFDLSTYAENFLRVGDAWDWESYSDDSSGGDFNTNVVPDTVFYQIGSFDGSSSGYNTAAYPAPPGDIGNWVFLAGTYDGTNWNLYRNGVLLNSFADNGEGPSGLTETWSVGSCSDPNPYMGMYFDGSIEEAAIFTNALDAATISNLYNSVHRPPVITLALQSPDVVYLGSSLVFNVWADGPGTLTYHWYSNNVALPAETGTNISLSNLTAAADGPYSVIVSNAYGSVTSSVPLLVTPTLPPTTLVPASEVRWIGFPLTFGPASLPNQSLQFQWYFDGSVIAGATNSTYSVNSSNGSAGTYTLVLSNSLGTSTSTPAMFTGVLNWPSGYASAILGDKPVAFWRLDETNGNTAHDYAGGNDGTYYLNPA